MGTVKIKTRDEYLLHLTVAFMPARVNVGMMGMKAWQRPEQPVAQQQKRKPLEEKENYRWLEGYQGACEVKRCREKGLGPGVGSGSRDTPPERWRGASQFVRPHAAARWDTPPRLPL